MKKHLFWLGLEDEAAIQAIQERYGCESQSQAVRLALRVLAASPMLTIQKPPTPAHARRTRRADSKPDTFE